jgi:hypothetical protein
MKPLSVLSISFLALTFQQTTVRAQQGLATGSINGTVLHAVSNGPLAGVRVTAQSPNRDSIVTTTDATGAFAFTSVGPASYRLTFAARGYVQQTYGQKNPDGAGTPVEIRAGEVVSGLILRLTPFGSVEGRVRDSNGNPAAGAPIELVRATYDGEGKKIFSPVSSVDTDDRGIYRIFWITPGRYYLRAGGRIRISSGLNPVNGRPQDTTGNVEPFAQIYYPNGASPEFAVPIDVRAGADLLGMDFRLQRQPLFRIQGLVVDAQTGQSPRDVDIGIVGDGWGMGGGSDRTDGTFQFRDLVPGSYRIVATSRVPQQNTQAEGGRQPVPASDYMPIQIIDKDVVDVVLRLLPPVPLTGRVVFEDNEGTPPRLSIRLEPFDGRAPTLLGTTLIGIVNADGSFKIPQIVGGDYMVRISDVGYYVKESRYGGSDLSNNPLRLTTSDSSTLDIKLSRRVAEVSGRITDNTSQAAVGARVVLVPDRGRHSRDLFKQATTDARGNYRFTNVWPGDYKLFAWESIETNSWHDPEVLKGFERDARPVRVRESASETIDARLIPAKPL